MGGRGLGVDVVGVAGVVVGTGSCLPCLGICNTQQTGITPVLNASVLLSSFVSSLVPKSIMFHVENVLPFKITHYKKKLLSHIFQHSKTH